MRPNILDDGKVLELMPHLESVKLRICTKLLPGTHRYLTKSGRITEATQNRLHLANSLQCDISQLVILDQVHSAKAIYVTQAYEVGKEPETDAMVTDKKDVVLAILTADCAPILFYDESRKIIGAAHAGWRGAYEGVIKNTIAEMKKLNATEINAVIGPMIRQESYEIGPEFFENFIKHDILNRRFFKNKDGGKFLFDLPGFIYQQLKNSGVHSISDSNLNSFTNKDLFFSYRRTSSFGDTHYGSVVSTICLK